MRSAASPLLRGALFLTGAGILSQVLGFIYRILLARFLGAENMGLYQLLMPVYAVALSIVSVGLTNAVSRLSAEYQALENHNALRALLRQVLRIFLFLCLLVFVPLILLYDPISVGILGDARTQLGLFLLLPCLLLTGIENLHKHYFYGTGQLVPPAVVELLEQSVRMAAVFLLLRLFLPTSDEVAVGLIVLGMTVCELFSSLTLLRLCRRRVGRLPHRGQAPEPRVLGRKIASIALPVGFTSLLGNLMTSANAVLIPQGLIRSGMEVEQAISQFGILFGMSLPFLMLPAAFMGPLCLILMPRLAEDRALGRRTAIRRKLKLSLGLTLLLMIPALLLLSTLGAPLGERLFHEPRMSVYLIPLAWGVLPLCIQSVSSSALTGLGLQKGAAISALLGDAVSLACTCFLVPLPALGIRGFLLGFFLGNLLSALVNCLLLFRSIRQFPVANPRGE